MRLAFLLVPTLLLACTDGTVSKDDTAGDADADGYVAAADCDDGDASVHPEAAEVCDGVDQDCDGAVDEDATDPVTYYTDADGDGFGVDASAASACTPPSGTALAAGDCDDTAASVSPDAEERCDGVDNDCDAEVDEATATDADTWYADADADGYGTSLYTMTACDAPAGYVADGTDCDDTDDGVNTAATEMCNGVDDDCNGYTDPGTAADAGTWFLDADGDGYGEDGTDIPACEQPEGYAALSGDCNDDAPAAFPGAAETCDGVDNDCDGTVDPNSATDAVTWYADIDGDGYGDATNRAIACTVPLGYAASSSDCDDTDDGVNPGASERCDGVDTDCDAATNEDGVATFYADSGAITDYSFTLAGTWTAAASATLSTDGALWMCPGRWYTRLAVAADVDVIGVGGSVTLDGAADGSVVSVTTDGVDVSLVDLTLQNGAGTTAGVVNYGGAVYCSGTTTAPSLSLDGVTIQTSVADLGGGLSAENCLIDLVDTVVSGNTALADAGGVWSRGATLTMDGVSVEDNVSGSDGGGMAISEASTLEMVDTVVTTNTAGGEAGGVYLDASDAICTGSTSGIAGIVSNSAADFGGVYVSTGATFEAVDCDLGTDADDNDPTDVDTYDYPYLYGDDETFTCTETRCGTRTTTTVGDTSSSFSASGYAKGNVILADEDTTLESFDVYMGSSSSCAVTFYVLSNTATSGNWTNEWYGSATVSGTGWVSASSVGVPIVSGTYYAFVTAWGSSCTPTYYYTYASSADAGFGTMDHTIWNAAYTATYSASVTSAYAYSTTFGPYLHRYYVSH